MKHYLLFALLFLGTLTINAQNGGIQPDDPSFIKRYENFDFKGQFAVLIDKDTRNNYFLLDFSKFSSRFERVYFMNLSFTSSKIVNIDPHITRDRICFISSQIYNEADIVKIFDELRSKTNDISVTWSQDEKSKWLKENDKHK